MYVGGLWDKNSLMSLPSRMIMRSWFLLFLCITYIGNALWEVGKKKRTQKSYKMDFVFDKSVCRSYLGELLYDFTIVVSL